MSFKLRKHQSKQNKITRKLLKDNDHILYGASTGYGKSVALWDLIGRDLKKGLRVLVLAPRRALVFQLEDTFSMYRPHVMMGSINRGDKDSGLILSSIHTTNSRLKQGSIMYENIDRIYIDEVHIGGNFPPAERSQFDLLYKRYWNSCKWVGFSATPITATGHRLEGWDETVYLYQTGKLIDMGFLAEYVYKAPVSMDTSSFKVNSSTNEYDVRDVENAVLDTANLKSIKKHTLDHYNINTKALIFCITIAHAELLKKSLARDDVYMIHSKMTDSEIYTALDNFKKASRGIMLNVSMLTTGFDDSTVNLLVIARPIKSLRLAIQVWGRGLRLHGDKVCTILDMCSVHEGCGVPEDERDFNRPRPPKVEKTEEVNTDKACEACGEASPVSEWKRKLKVKKQFDVMKWKCPACKHVKKDVKEHRVIEGLIIIHSRKKRLEALSEASEGIKPTSYKQRKPLVYELVEENTNAKPAMSHFICSEINKAKLGKMLDYVLFNYERKIITSKQAWKAVELIWQEAKEKSPKKS